MEDAEIKTISLIESSGVIRKQTADDDSRLASSVKLSYDPQGNTDKKHIERFALRVDVDIKSVADEKKQTTLGQFFDATVTVVYAVVFNAETSLEEAVRQMWPYMRTSALTQLRLMGLGTIEGSLPVTLKKIKGKDTGE
ncbi:hypothetical protein OZX73_03975 [Bifidobacterium sp. ESL0775]|uniref:hypothetical protein n=1 Tax=Bifidobacterium sp. ESL0775 TaxID=2983230 RepID=UPI0023F9D80D|nr:hypothetical protein [Bifidobacterium sp. ESL0775]WEV70022.1 hypothetical protein OZX73_03975 [Bifidobacterium sp. ESL0775]